MNSVSKFESTTPDICHLVLNPKGNTQSKTVLGHCDLSKAPIDINLNVLRLLNPASFVSVGTRHILYKNSGKYCLCANTRNNHSELTKKGFHHHKHDPLGKFGAQLHVLDRILTRPEPSQTLKKKVQSKLKKFDNEIKNDLSQRQKERVANRSMIFNVLNQYPGIQIILFIGTRADALKANISRTLKRSRRFTR